jgi:hypothetical protein
MSNVKFIQQQQQVTMHKVTALTGGTKEVYYSYLHSCALDWLMLHLRGNADAVDDVMQCEVFWSWWYLNAYHRDNEWLTRWPAFAKNDTESERLYNDWLYYHSAERLNNMEYKHALILFNGYANINWAADTNAADATLYINAEGKLTNQP